MSKQDQAVSDSATAYQAGRDIIVSGVSVKDVIDISKEVAQSILVGFSKEAKEILETRISQFEEKICERFFSSGGAADPSAFRDPDFNATFVEAERAYARNGDEEIRETLINIIAKRSLEPSGSRRASALNRAASIAPLLTKSEFACLSLIFLGRQCKKEAAHTGLLYEFIYSNLRPFAADIDDPEASIAHLEAHGCGRYIRMIGHSNFEQLLHETYGGLLSHGIPEADFRAVLSENGSDVLYDIMIKCPDGCVRPNVLGLDEFKKEAAIRGVNSDKATAIWARFAMNMKSKSEIMSDFHGDAQIARLFELFEDAFFGGFDINSLGVALGYANAVHRIGLEADLSIWIR